jgi:hypothetical protein
MRTLAGSRQTFIPRCFVHQSTKSHNFFTQNILSPNRNHYLTLTTLINMTAPSPPSPPSPPTAECTEQSPGVQSPRRRPKKMTSPRRSRTSMANVYSPEVTEKKVVGGFKNPLPLD